jgi:hypothetical protein
MLGGGQWDTASCFAECGPAGNATLWHAWLPATYARLVSWLYSLLAATPNLPPAAEGKPVGYCEWGVKLQTVLGVLEASQQRYRDASSSSGGGSGVGGYMPSDSVRVQLADAVASLRNMLSEAVTLNQQLDCASSALHWRVFDILRHACLPASLPAWLPGCLRIPPVPAAAAFAKHPAPLSPRVPPCCFVAASCARPAL